MNARLFYTLLSSIVALALVILLDIVPSASVQEGALHQPQAPPEQIGQWAGPFGWPIPAVHMSLQSNGEVLIWNEDRGGLDAHIWNPTLDSFASVPSNNTNLFCSGHTHLADGNSFVIGGHLSQNYEGVVDTNIYDWANQLWVGTGDMSFPRWYATATTLPDGRVLAISGSMTPESGLATIPEVYDPSFDVWKELPGADFLRRFYSQMFVAPNGQIFDAGPDDDTYYLDVESETWTFVGDSIIDGHSAVMYKPGQVMKSGAWGDPDRTQPPAHNRTVVIDLIAPSPAWREVAPMANARSFHNLVLLPDGKVLAVGGEGSTYGQCNGGAVFEAELWNPATETWRTMAAMQRPRCYHSTALLLPDGRVVSAGGYFPPYVEENAEIYFPPYLFQGTRPTIISAPASISYSNPFLVETVDTIARVSLIRLGSTTHGFDQDQRFVELSFTPVTNGLYVQSPANANLAPPGYYMLFILNSDDVPSVAQFIRLEAASFPTLPIGPTYLPVILKLRS